MRRTAQLLRSLLSVFYYYRWPGDSVFAVGSFFPRGIECRGAVRKQLAFYKEHQIQPRKLTDTARFSLVLWSRLFNWRGALMIVKPETLIGWHRKDSSCFGGGSRGQEGLGFRKTFAC